MKDKLGNKITLKEFFQRWGEGIQQVTPFQQIKISLVGHVFVTIGIIFGLIIMAMSKIWWLLIILVGSLFLTSMAFLGALQKYFALKKIHETMMQAEAITKATTILNQLNQEGGKT